MNSTKVCVNQMVMTWRHIFLASISVFSHGRLLQSTAWIAERESDKSELNSTVLCAGASSSSFVSAIHCFNTEILWNIPFSSSSSSTSNQIRLRADPTFIGLIPSFLLLFQRRDFRLHIKPPPPPRPPPPLLLRSFLLVSASLQILAADSAHMAHLFSLLLPFLRSEYNSSEVWETKCVWLMCVWLSEREKEREKARKRTRKKTIGELWRKWEKRIFCLFVFCFSHMSTAFLERSFGISRFFFAKLSVQLQKQSFFLSYCLPPFSFSPGADVHLEIFSYSYSY